MEDEDSILPRKLQVALEHILEQRNELACDQDAGPLDGSPGKGSTLRDHPASEQLHGGCLPVGKPPPMWALKYLCKGGKTRLHVG